MPVPLDLAVHTSTYSRTTRTRSPEGRSPGRRHGVAVQNSARQSGSPLGEKFICSDPKLTYVYWTLKSIYTLCSLERASVLMPITLAKPIGRLVASCFPPRIQGGPCGLQGACSPPRDHIQSTSREEKDCSANAHRVAENGQTTRTITMQRSAISSIRN